MNSDCNQFKDPDKLKLFMAMINQPAAATMQRCAEIIAELGVPKKSAMPPLYCKLWRYGFAVRPPIYATSVYSLILHGTITGIIYGGCMRLLEWKNLNIVNVLVSLTYGFSMAAATRWGTSKQRKKYRLPPWNEILERAVNTKTIEQSQADHG